jgi:hypothetical protein
LDDVVPDRVPRRLPRLDHGRIDGHLSIAVSAGGTVFEVTQAVSASSSTLARHEGHYA